MLTGYEILQKQKFVKKICDFILKKIADFEKVHLLKFVQKSVLKISRFCFLQKFIESIPKQL